jgi:hypothetical protein
MTEDRQIIRVFARKTNWTPTDGLAFCDEPPLFDVPNLPVYVSVTFTWDKARGIQLAKAWQNKCKHICLGGPAFDDRGGEFVPGRFLKRGVTITSRGCPKKCSWCLVPDREGEIVELPVAEGYIVQDNNLLGCSEGHIRAVFDMLRNQRRAAQFKGGLDIVYLKPWHVDLLNSIRVSELWIACDSGAALKKLDKASELLADFSIEKRRCYVLVAYPGDTIADAERRCEAVYREEKGFLPFVQLFQPGPGWRVFDRDWREMCFRWSTPRVYRTKKLKYRKSILDGCGG